MEVLIGIAIGIGLYSAINKIDNYSYEKEIYDSGYNDGYEDGYKDGFWEGGK